MDRLSAMQLFVRAAENGSFSSTAREAGQLQSSVSKQIAALEKHLGVRLLARTTRRLTLTEEGAHFYDEARRIVDDVAALDESTRKASHSLNGRIRLGAAVGFGRSILMPKLKKFLELHPGISIEFRQSDEMANVVAEGLDLTIRIGELRDSSLVARSLGITHRCAMASAVYLEQAPPIKAPSDLTKHNCIAYTGVAQPDTWFFQNSKGSTTVRVKGNLQCSNSEGIRAAVTSDMGISYSPTWLFLEELKRGMVQKVLPHHRGRVVPVHAVYAAGRAQPFRIRNLVDFLEAEFARDPFVSKEQAEIAGLLRTKPTRSNNGPSDKLASVARPRKFA
jgi:DNA-binding transcriptional LysR family regulator